MTEDAVAWVVQAPELLALAPRRWRKRVLTEHRDCWRDWRLNARARLRAGRYQEPFRPVLDWCHAAGEGWLNGLNGLWANGDIGYHTDEDFHPWTALLFLWGGDYRLSGAHRWRGDDPQPDGTLILFNCHLPHCLTRPGVTHEDAMDGDIWLDTAPRRTWIAATADFADPPTESEVRAFFHRSLTVLQENA